MTTLHVTSLHGTVACRLVAHHPSLNAIFTACVFYLKQQVSQCQCFDYIDYTVWYNNFEEFIALGLDFPIH